MITRTHLALIALYLLLYILPLGLRPAQRPDELRYAEIPREMLASGEWVVPHLNGLRYFEKPPLGYWVTAASFQLFGENNFAMRLPSALAAGIAAWLLLLFARRHFGKPRLGLFSAVIFLTMAQVYVIGVSNLLDSLLATLLTCAMITFYEAFHAKERQQRLAWLALFGVACGLAFLTKGFLAFALPGIVIVPFLLWTRRWKYILLDAWIPALALALVVLPWSIMIYLREPLFWSEFFWLENVRRFVSVKAEHAGPIYFFIPKLLEAAFPWTFVLPAAFMGLRGYVRENHPLRFVICWFLFPFLFFSIAHGKLTTYIQPCFPPLALLIAVGLDRYLASGRHKVVDIGAGVLAVLLGCGVLGLGIIQRTGFGPGPVFTPLETGLWFLASVGIAVWIAALVFAIRASEGNKKILLFALAPCLFFFSVHFLASMEATKLESNEAFFRRSALQTPGDSILIVDGEIIRSVNWYFKRADAYLFDTVDELGYGIKCDPASRQRYIQSFEALAGFIAERGNSQPLITVVMETELYTEEGQKLPKPLVIDQTDDYTFLQFRPAPPGK